MWCLHSCLPSWNWLPKPFHLALLCQMWVTVCLSCVALSWLFSEGIAWLRYVSKITRRSVGWFIFPYGPSEWDIPASRHTQLWKMFGFVNLWYRDESVVSLEYHLLPSSSVTWQSRFWVDGLPTFLSRSGGTLVWYTRAVQSYPLSLLWEPPWSEWMKTLNTFPLFSFFPQKWWILLVRIFLLHCSE